jgi:hypothetical protein
VTDAGGGLGLAAAVGLAARGIAVARLDINENSATEAALENGHQARVFVQEFAAPGGAEAALP